MSIKPILFSAPMVRALLEGRKTQTRRVAKFIEPIPERGTYHICNSGGGLVGVAESDIASCAPDYAPYQTGDRLWVREAWGKHIQEYGDAREERRFVYRADGVEHPSDNGTKGPWKPSIHMPRRASRITLVVAAVRVQKLQEISDDDAIAEGCVGLILKKTPSVTPREDFAALWKSINGPGSWDANPWVVAYTFTVHKRNIDNIEPANE